MGLGDQGEKRYHFRKIRVPCCRDIGKKVLEYSERPSWSFLVSESTHHESSNTPDARCSAICGQSIGLRGEKTEV